MHIYQLSYKRIKDSKFSEITDEFILDTGEEISEKFVEGILEILEKAIVPIFLKQKDSGIRYLFFHSEELDQVIGLPIVEKLEDFEGRKIRTFYVQTNEENGNLVFLGNKAYLANYEEFFKNVTTALIKNFVDDKRMYWRDGERSEFENTDYALEFDRKNLAIFRTNEKKPKYAIFLEIPNRRLVIPAVRRGAKIIALLGMGQNRIISREIGELPNKIHEDAVDELLGVIELVENIKYTAS
jgi:hypothetical protein